jgi:succinate dehydrogenase / fumarate reductase membrane anchor subunit
MAEAYDVGPERWSLFLWVMQRITGIFLVVLLFLHVIWLHFVDPLSVVTVAGVKLRLQALLFGVTDTLLLGFTVFHGMNGMRSVLYDYVGSPLWRKAITWGLMAAGGTLFVYGLWAFLPFVLGFD